MARWTGSAPLSVGVPEAEAAAGVPRCSQVALGTLVVNEGPLIARSRTGIHSPDLAESLTPSFAGNKGWTEILGH